MNTYDDCLSKMYSLRRFGIKLGLDVIGTILDNLGNPQHGFNAIHIAGTNGKGSVAATLASILQESGFSVGLYTSPHLVRFNERISVDGAPIADEDVVNAYKAVESANRADRDPTFFEFTTAMALCHFGNRKIEWGIIETGMGGRLDATNMLKPKVTVITNISLEHRSYLGDTLSAIAYEKAGIIKPGIPVVTGATQPSALAVIRRTAAGKKAPLFRRGEAFRVRRTPGDTFTYFGTGHRWRGLKTQLPGNHQVDNAALTLAVCEQLIESGVPITPDQIISGLANTRWPGRLDVVSTSPLVILDGAHNLMAARNLSRYLSSHIPPEKLIMVLGVLDDKPIDAMLSALLPTCQRVIITQAKIDRAIPAELLSEKARRWAANVQVVPSVSEAVALAIGEATGDEAVCVAGSLYVVGEAMTALDALNIKG